ncbi:MAG: serine/threonine-protein phosphatase [Salinivirgaceae bacterium]|nr:serine/threonine-protein phosphatase [Salinivirgaceae bacterium]
MSDKIQFRLTAYSDAAGKYSPQAPLNGNEDSFFVDDDLFDNMPNHCTHDQIVSLGNCGMLMAVADGMGGMNAGEVASAIAIKTIEDFFAFGKVTPEMAASKDKREKYLESLIVEADSRIKADEQVNPDHQGMGSTIILAWMVGTEITVSWCGDSRAYRFNPETGIEMLSEDHSYVQDLVRKGILRYSETFGHPQGNIVTRSLGDPSGPARPETRHFSVYQNDIILLCSDGLCGVVYDRPETDESGNLLSKYNLQDLIATNTGSMIQCRQALFNAAEKSDWYDNVTAVLCQITNSPNKLKVAQSKDAHSTCVDLSKTETDIKTGSPDNTKEKYTHSVFVIAKRNVRFAIAIICVIVLGAVVCVLLMRNSTPKQPSQLQSTTQSFGEKQNSTPNADTTNNVVKNDSSGIQRDESRLETANKKNNKQSQKPNRKNRNRAEENIVDMNEPINKDSNIHTVPEGFTLIESDSTKKD